jgi:hypothetical protein
LLCAACTGCVGGVGDEDVDVGVTPLPNSCDPDPDPDADPDDLWPPRVSERAAATGSTYSCDAGDPESECTPEPPAVAADGAKASNTSEDVSAADARNARIGREVSSAGRDVLSAS